eukprot:gene10138-11220_t
MKLKVSLLLIFLYLFYTSYSELVETFAGYTNATYSLRGDGGNALAAKVNEPAGLFIDSNGNIYLAEHYYIRKISTNGIITTLAGVGSSGGSTSESIAATAAFLNYTWGIAANTAGIFYYSEYYGCRIRTISTSLVVTTLAGQYGVCSYSGDNGQATTATLNNPAGIFYYASKDVVIIADSSNNRIRYVDTTGAIYTVAGSATAGFLNADSATNGQLNHPMDMYMDMRSTVYIMYIADRDNCVIRKVTMSNGAWPGAAQQLSTYAGTGTCIPSGSSGSATSAGIDHPVSVCGDTNGNTYFGDYTINYYRRLDQANTGVFLIISFNSTYQYGLRNGGQGTNSRVGLSRGCKVYGGTLYLTDFYYNMLWRLTAPNINNGILYTVQGYIGGVSIPASSAFFQSITSIYVDSTGAFYLTEPDRHYVHKITAASPHNVSVFSGIGVGGYYAENVPASLSALNDPISVVGDTNGNIFVSENKGNRVRKIAATGSAVTAAGNGPSCCASSTYSGNAASLCSLCNPRALAYDSSANVLYIADDSCVIRKLLISSATISTFAGTGSCSFVDNVAPSLASFGIVYGLWYNPQSSSLYISDPNNNRIRRTNTTSLITYVGTSSGGSNGDYLAATLANLTYNRGICGDTSGTLYVTLLKTPAIRAVRASDRTIFTNIGNGVAGIGGEDVESSLAPMGYSPTCLVYGGALYYAEYLDEMGSTRLRKSQIGSWSHAPTIMPVTASPTLAPSNQPIMTPYPTTSPTTSST